MVAQRLFPYGWAHPDQLPSDGWSGESRIARHIMGQILCLVWHTLSDSLMEHGQRQGKVLWVLLSDRRLPHIQGRLNL